MIQKKLFLLFCAFITIPVLIFSAISYAFVYKTTQRNTVDIYSSVLAETISSFENQYEIINNLTYSLSNTEWTNSILRKDMNQISKDFSFNELREYNSQFSVYKSANDFIDEIGIIFPQSQLVFSSVGKSDLEWFVEEAFFIKEISYNKWLDYCAKDDISVVLNSTLMTHGLSRKGLIYIVTLKSTITNHHGVFVVFTNVDTIRENFNRLLDKESFFVMNDRYGETVYKSDESVNLDELEHINDFMVKHNDTKYIWLESTSEKTGITHYYAVPYTKILNGLRSIKYLLFAIVLASLAVGYTLSYIIAKKNYLHVDRILGLFRNRLNAPDEEKNEYVIIENMVQAILEEGKELEEKLTDYVDIAQQYHLRSMMEDTKQPINISIAKLKKSGIVFQYKYYCCGTIPVSDIGEFGVLDDIAVHLSFDGMVLGYDFGYKRTYLFGYYDKDKLKQYITQLSNMLEQKGIKLFISPAVRKIEDIKKVNLSLQDNIAHLTNGGVNNVKLDSSVCYFPVDLEYKISNCLKIGNHSAAIQVFEKLVAKNEEQYGSHSNEVASFFIKAYNSLMRILKENKIDSAKLISINEFNNLRIKEKAQYIKQAYSNMNIHKNTSTSNISVIKQFIDENYYKHDMSLSYVASAFRINIATLSKLYKKEIGVNFLEYLNRVRISKAKILLETTKKNISEICVLVGYDSITTFRRAFKKYEGIQPSQYRQAKQK